MAVKGKAAAPKKPLKQKAKEPEPEEVEEELEDDEPEEDDEEAEEDDEEQEEQSAKTKGDGKAKKKGPPPKKARDPLVRLVAEPEAKFGGPQVQGILKCLQENDNEMKLSELIHALEDGEYIKTQQKVERIFAFYRRGLINAGAIEVV